MVDGMSYGNAVDWWAFGCLLHQVLLMDCTCTNLSNKIYTYSTLVLDLPIHVVGCYTRLYCVRYPDVHSCTAPNPGSVRLQR